MTVGGELTLEMLDLSFNAIAKFYEAPLQMKANGGVFVVDDFGRQRIRPRDLLNRWIVPLESRVDYLTLHTGKKFEMPFDVLIVFATNLNPESLADEAFLRRIPYKIYAKNPTADEFGRIFELNCKRRNIAFDPVIVDYLSRRYYEPRGLDMRACHPRDIVEQVVDICRYENRPLVITRELLDQACKNYFLEEQAGQAERPACSRRREGQRRAARRRRAPASRTERGMAVLSQALESSVRDGRGRRAACGDARARVRVRRPGLHQRPVRASGLEDRRRVRDDGAPHGSAAARQRAAGRGADGGAPAGGRRRSCARDPRSSRASRLSVSTSSAPIGRGAAA